MAAAAAAAEDACHGEGGAEEAVVEVVSADRSPCAACPCCGTQGRRQQPWTQRTRPLSYACDYAEPLPLSAAAAAG